MISWAADTILSANPLSDAHYKENVRSYICSKVATAEDDGFGSLTPERYITIRLGDQLNYYRHKTNDLKKELKRW
jgi:hypothetical protein